MTGREEQASVDNDAILVDLAVSWVKAVMRSVDSNVVKPRDWWERAKTSLTTAAAVADNWPQMVSHHMRKLQVSAVSPDTAIAVEVMGAQLTELGSEAWPRFRALCERDALYIVAMAQAESARKKQERKAKQLDMLREGE